MSSPGSASGAAFNVGEVIDSTYRRFKYSLAKCLPLAMVAVVAGNLAAFYWLATGRSLTDLATPRDATFYLLSGIGWILNLWLMSAVMIRMHEICAGRARPVAQDLGAAARSAPRWLLACLLSALIGIACLLPFMSAVQLLGGSQIAPMALVASMLLLAPLLYVAVLLTLMMPLVLIETVSPLQALRESYRRVRPIWVKVLAALIIVLLIAIICAGTTLSLLQILILPLLKGVPAAAQALSTTIALALYSSIQLFFLALLLELHSSSSSKDSD